MKRGSGSTIEGGFTYCGSAGLSAKKFKSKTAQRIFQFAPMTVLIYIGLMLFRTVKLWDLTATTDAYNELVHIKIQRSKKFSGSYFNGFKINVGGGDLAGDGPHPTFILKN